MSEGTTYLNKLVRDKIPDIVLSQGFSCCFWKLISNDEYLGALKAKLQEEMDEYLLHGDPEELIDIYDVLEAIVEVVFSDVGGKDELPRRSKLKRELNGYFTKRYYIHHITADKGSDCGVKPVRLPG